MNQPHVLARQSFDGLGRQRTVEVGPRLTQHHYCPGQLPAQSNTLADGSQLHFSYERQLDNALLSTRVQHQQAEQLAYHPVLGLPQQADAGLGSLTWQYSAAGHLLEERWQVDHQTYRSSWRHSLGGRVLSLTDSAGAVHAREYDGCGRLSLLTVGDLQTRFSYDALSRPASVDSLDPASGNRLHQAFAYDSIGRLASIRFATLQAGVNRSFSQTLSYTGLDQLSTRRWSEAGQEHVEQFSYDLRQRLTHYRVNPEADIRDPFGNQLVEQRFAFNALDGYREVLSVFADGSQDLASFAYAENDPTQVIAISHSHPSWPARIELHYDGCGRLIADSLGRQLAWNEQGRLSRVTLAGQTCEYRYDASGRLRDRQLNGEVQRSFYSAEQLTHEQHGSNRLALAGDGGSLFALTHIADSVRQTCLLGSDGQGSIRLQLGENLHSDRYSPHGSSAEPQPQVPFAYTGERREPLTGWYIAAGYRPYDPLLMCFLAPDSDSPFGRGGINGYAYCGGDPVNRIDPDGHSWLTWTAAGIGIGLGIGATLASLGTALPAIAALLGGGGLSASAALAVSSAALNVVSLGTGIAAMALQASGKDQQAASVLGWISLGSGLASALTSIAPRLAQSVEHMRQAAGRSASKMANFQPYKLGPGGTARPASVLYGTSRNGQDVAFVPSLFGEGDAALVTHGNLLGKLMNAQGLADDAVNVASDILLPRLAQMGYADGRKVVLLSCWGGKSGAAQQIANVLGRPVDAYGEKLFVKSLASLQSQRTLGGTLHSTNVPVFKAPLWQRWFGQADFSDTRRYRIATAQLYLPQ
ncbi:RHS repeat-associated core domain-containing protein [Pseudomonas shirazensis]|uniref:RHS repeat-associated core domain-containing protein n=1 Tax=Pseudomonas shirazensis TaxID=2745494 RepID=UPI003D2DE4CE